jgi:predicted metal-dependent phosphoesterase TrpH
MGQHPSARPLLPRGARIRAKNREGDHVPQVWSKADLHIHSTHSDGLATPEEIVAYAATKTDLKVIAVTDHNSIEGSLRAREAAVAHPGIEVVIGSEITSKWGHILGLYLTEDVAAGMSAVDTIAAINEQGGVAIIAHPFANRAFGPWGLKSLGRKIDEVAFQAMEVYNSSPYLIYANRLAAKAFAAGQGIAATGGSDAHVLKAVGRGYTLYRGSTAQDLRRSIDELETCAHAQRGGLSIAFRYMVRFPQIRRQRALNIDRCAAR